MGLKLCLDSNIFIAIHNQESNHAECERIIKAIEENRHKGIISTIVITEILVGYYQIGDINEMNVFSAKIKVGYDLIPISINIAQEAAELRALSRIRLPDALILATAKISQADYLISNDIMMQKKTYMPILTVEECIKELVL